MGRYSLDFRYANGNGPIAAGAKAAIRSLEVDGVGVGAVVIPQRGDRLWTDWGYSNGIPIDLNPGRHTC
jgi:hypothetical protein